MSSPFHIPGMREVEGQMDVTGNQLVGDGAIVDTVYGRELP